MKNRKIKVLINILILISISLIFNKNIVLRNKKQILKEIDDSTQVTELNSSIDKLNSEHDEYKRYIENSKAQIAQALREKGVQTEDTASFEIIASSIRSISNFTEVITGSLTWGGRLTSRSIAVSKKPKLVVVISNVNIKSVDYWTDERGILDDYIFIKEVSDTQVVIESSWDDSYTFSYLIAF